MPFAIFHMGPGLGIGIPLNLLCNPILMVGVYGFCIYIGLFGIIHYLWLVDSGLRGKWKDFLEKP